MDDRQIYEKLRKFRRARGISLGQLAKEMGENSQMVGRVERGQRSLTVDYLLKVSKALSMPIETLLEDSATAEGFTQSLDSNILNAVVVLVDEMMPLLSPQGSSQQKGKLVSQIYELILKLPNENRYSFFRTLRDCMLVFVQKK